jgi:hypothetical protein
MHSTASSPARRLFLALALLASAALALPALVHAQTRYTITNIGPGTKAIAINASGTSLGTNNNQTVVYSGGSASPVPGLNLPATATIISGMNASGAIAGTSFSSSGVQTAFIVAGGVLTDLGLGQAGGINDAGTVAVYAVASGPYLRSATGVVTPLPEPSNARLFINALNGAGTAAGFLFDLGSFLRRAALATPAGVTLLDTRPGGGGLPDSGEISMAYAINSAGVAVGFALVPGSGRRAVLFSGGSFTNLDPTGTADSEAFAINSDGTVVGNGPNRPAFVYTAATGLVNLSTLVNNLAASGFTALTSAAGINDTGQIIGVGTVGGAPRVFRLDPVAGPAVAPAITTHPAAQTVAAGGSVTFSVAATGSPAPSYEWRFNTTPIAGATAASYAIAAVSNANAGSYTVRVFNTAGTVTSNAATLTVTAAPPPSAAARLVNLSILTSLAGTGDSFTMGYVVGGAGTGGTKPLVIRAAGPSLTPLGVGGALADPQLTLFAGPTQNGANDNWGGGATLLAAMTGVGAFPFASATSLDAAVATSVAAGDNSVRVAPVGNLSGQVIAEIYDATPDASFTATTPRLVNVSVLKNIGTSLTAGFVIRGGTGSRTVLIRAIGPTLGAAPFNVPGVVADPQLVLFNSASAQIGANDNWGGTAALTAAFTATGAFQLPAASRDAALLVTLQPGNYTVQVSGIGGTSGTALVEVYEVP